MLRIIILLFVFSSSFAQSSDEKEVLALSKKKFEWLVSKKMDSLSSVLDERLQYVHSNGWIESKKDVMDDMASGKLTYQSVDIHEATARVYNQTAIINGTGKFQVVMSGTSLSFELGYTEVYIRTDGRWQLTSRHANRMP
jgi:hypothetical protein